MRVGFVIMFGLRPSVPEMTSMKVKLVSCYSHQAPFYHNWVYMNEMTFGKYLKVGLVAQEPTVNRGLELSTLLPDVGGGGGTRGRINH